MFETGLQLAIKQKWTPYAYADVNFDSNLDEPLILAHIYLPLMFLGVGLF
jgi:hypothetical protein